MPHVADRWRVNVGDIRYSKNCCSTLAADVVGHAHPPAQQPYIAAKGVIKRSSCAADAGRFIMGNALSNPACANSTQLYKLYIKVETAERERAYIYI